MQYHPGEMQYGGQRSASVAVRCGSFDSSYMETLVNFVAEGSSGNARSDACLSPASAIRMELRQEKLLRFSAKQPVAWSLWFARHE